MWQRQLLRFAIFAVLFFLYWLAGCSSTAFQKYESSVDSRSIEGYGKDSGNSASAGLKYTVHYK
jgi:hypothetical protein